MKQFVEITDDLLYRENGPPGPLVPYHCGVFCWHQLRKEAMAPPAQHMVQAAVANRSSDGLALSA